MTETETVLFAAAVGVLSSIATALVSHFLVRKREVLANRDKLRLRLYTDITDWIVENEELHASRTGDFSTPDIEIQRRRLRIYHRLRLVASSPTLEAYKQYRKLLYTETELPRDQWPSDPSAIFDARDHFVDRLRDDLQTWRDGEPWHAPESGLRAF
ncbi:hypothetical protein N9N28_16060 [Rubripirellula amarantea]|nr:hypothetical protein [Rubripirellula amarantea]